MADQHELRDKGFARLQKNAHQHGNVEQGRRRQARGRVERADPHQAEGGHHADGGKPTVIRAQTQEAQDSPARPESGSAAWRH